MKSKLFILAFIGFLFVACRTNAPKEPQIYSGDVVGYVGCYDEREMHPFDREKIHKGLVIRTDKNDSLLTFTLNTDSIIGHPIVSAGTHSIREIPLEFDFYYNVIDSTDERYVKIWPIIETMDHPTCTLPDKQVEIIFIK